MSILTRTRNTVAAGTRRRMEMSRLRHRFVRRSRFSPPTNQRIFPLAGLSISITRVRTYRDRLFLFLHLEKSHPAIVQRVARSSSERAEKTDDSKKYIHAITECFATDWLRGKKKMSFVIVPTEIIVINCGRHSCLSVDYCDNFI